MRLLVSLMTIMLLLANRAPAADSEVSGRYLAGAGSDVRILLTISKPPPAVFIVRQKIPPGVHMTSASPDPAGVQQEGAIVKWLFKRPQSGSVLITLELSAQVPETRLEGEISYRHPRTGALVVQPISN